MLLTGITSRWMLPSLSCSNASAPSVVCQELSRLVAALVMHRAFKASTGWTRLEMQMQKFGFLAAIVGALSSPQDTVLINAKGGRKLVR